MANRTLLELPALVLHWNLQNYLGKDAETDKKIKVFHPHPPYALVTILVSFLFCCPLSNEILGILTLTHFFPHLRYASQTDPLILSHS